MEISYTSQIKHKKDYLQIQGKINYDTFVYISVTFRQQTEHHHCAQSFWSNVQMIMQQSFGLKYLVHAILLPPLSQRLFCNYIGKHYSTINIELINFYSLPVCKKNFLTYYMKNVLLFIIKSKREFVPGNIIVFASVTRTIFLEN